MSDWLKPSCCMDMALRTMTFEDTGIPPIGRSSGFVENLELHLPHFVLKMKRPMKHKQCPNDSETELDDV
jgi:hypothetical protein